MRVHVCVQALNLGGEREADLLHSSGKMGSGAVRASMDAGHQQGAVGGPPGPQPGKARASREMQPSGKGVV